jgi:hypothetical protein
MSFREKEFITSLQQGDKPTFDFLFRSHYSASCSYANSYMKSMDTSEQTVKDVLIKLLEKHDKIFVHTSILACLFQAVQSAAFKHVDIAVENQGAGLTDTAVWWDVSRKQLIKYKISNHV